MTTCFLFSGFFGGCKVSLRHVNPHENHRAKRFTIIWHNLRCKYLDVMVYRMLLFQTHYLVSSALLRSLSCKKRRYISTLIPCEKHIFVHRKISDQSSSCFVLLMCGLCKQCIWTNFKPLMNEYATIFFKRCCPAWTNDFHLHNFLFTIDSGSLFY